MRKKHGDNIPKKDWIWSSFLLMGSIVIMLALGLDLGIVSVEKVYNTAKWAEIRSNLWQASEIVSDIVIAYSAMLSTIVVFYYSVIENKRLGIPYRRFISYTIGSRTIPILFTVTLLLTIVMAVIRYIPLKHTMFACAAYILLVQTFAIIEILLSTSYEHCKRVIYFIFTGREYFWHSCI